MCEGDGFSSVAGVDDGFVGAVIGWFACDGEKKGGTEGIDVRTEIDCYAGSLFGVGEERCSEHGPGHGDGGIFHLVSGEAKAGEAGVAVVSDDYVFGFDVAMYDAECFGHAHALSNPIADGDGFFFFEASCAFHQLPQGRAFHMLEGLVVEAIGCLPRSQGVNDVGVVQLGEYAGSSEEPPNNGFVPGRFRAQHRERSRRAVGRSAMEGYPGRTLILDAFNGVFTHLTQAFKGCLGLLCSHLLFPLIASRALTCLPGLA